MPPPSMHEIVAYVASAAAAGILAAQVDLSSTLPASPYGVVPMGDGGCLIELETGTLVTGPDGEDVCAMSLMPR